MMRELIGIRRAGGGALRLLADMFTDDTLPPRASDESVDATIIFADIENFSDLVARTGDEAASRVLDALDLAVDQAIAGTRCRLVKRLGDGVMIAADDPGEGISAAVALPARFLDNIAAEPFSLRLRVGAHRGVVRRRGDDLIGYHVNVAARVAEQAVGGSTLVTAALYDSVTVSEVLEVRPAGMLVAKGVPERPRLYSLTRARTSTV
ncbi:MAG TPA: adenylate/guanylate cyclase domain-containing protein [Euzebya sp.]|nr:adenylate/guanylate cyclase domain-containing protein [Euzebya sp.]